MKPENPPAFPYQQNPAHGGMTLRDWFAGQALSNPNICRYEDEYPQYVAYAFADAMLKAREK